MRKKISNLVFEGGGVKGIAYIGAMQELEKQNILQNVKRVGGTSAGAINACLFALKYNVDEQQKILSALDFKRFEDASFPLKFSQLTLKDKLFCKNWWLTCLGGGLNLWFRKGLHSGDYFHNWIGKIIEDKMGKKNATFIEIFEQTNIELHICTANVSTGLAEIFSYRTTPHCEVAKAVRISMSIPFFFSPVELTSEKGIKSLYVDGGIFRNYPIRLFDNYKFIDQSTNVAENILKNDTPINKERFMCNNETLGFRLDSRSEIHLYKDGIKPKEVQISNTVEYFKAVFSSILAVQENQHLNENDWERTVYVDTLGVSTVDFSLSEEKKYALIESGRLAVREYMQEQTESNVPNNEYIQLQESLNDKDNLQIKT